MRIRLQALLVFAASIGTMAMVAQSGIGAAQAGSYRLTSVAGNALPTPLGMENGCKEMVTAGTLTLSDGKWTLRYDERHECPSGARMSAESETGKYSMDGSTITFMDDDGERNTGGSPDDDIDLDELDHGTLSGNTLTVKLKEGQTVVFQR